MSVTCVDLPSQKAFDPTLLIKECQQLAERIARPFDGAETISSLKKLTMAIPDRLSELEHLMVRGLLSQAISRIVSFAHLDGQPEIVRAFLEWAANAPQPDAWRSDWLGLLTCCAAQLAERKRGTDSSQGTVSICARRALQVIRSRYHDPALRLSAVAKDANLTPSHVTRTLKRHTGQGFVAHLRRARVSAAQRLLTQTSLSVKEIAAAVGYGHPNQLDRHFLQTYGTTPSQFRRAAISI